MATSAPTMTTINKTEARSTGGMVATKDIHATKAGLQMLEMGGNAVDAAVAACFAIGVVEPWSCGIGGGGYMVYQLGDRGGVIGFPMKGPLDAAPDMYEFTGEAAVGNFGWPGVVNNENLEGFRSIAVPGAVAGLCEANKRLGKLPLSEVIAPAVSLARDGHSPGWHNIYSLGLMSDKLFAYDELGSVFMAGGKLPTGDLTSPANLRQPDLANVLEAIGKDGASAFYSGDIAEAITSDIRASGGILSMRDLAEYKPFVWDGGLEFGYSGHTVRVPPFQCAGTTSAMTLKLLDGFDISGDGTQLARRAARLYLLHATGICGQVQVHGRSRVCGRAVGGAGVRWVHRVPSRANHRRTGWARSNPATPGHSRKAHRHACSKRARPRLTREQPISARWTRMAARSRSPTRLWPDLAPGSFRRGRAW